MNISSSATVSHKGHRHDTPPAQPDAPRALHHAKHIHHVGADADSCSCFNTNFTAAVVPAPVNLNSHNNSVPWFGPHNGLNAGSSSGSDNGKSGNGAMYVRDGIAGAVVFGTVLGDVAALLA